MVEEKYYSIQEIADMLKVAYLTVYRWIQAGKLKSVRAGKQHRVSEVRLDEFLKKEHK